MSAPVPSSTASHGGSSVPNLSLTIPEGNRDAIVAHMKRVLANPNLSPSDLETIVDNLLVIANQEDRHFYTWGYNGVTGIIGDGNAPQIEPFLRILGRKYYDSYSFAVESLLRHLTTPDQLQAFLEGLRQNQGPIKGNWHADRYTLAMVDMLLKAKTIPSCTPRLQSMREELKHAVEALPPSQASDVLKFKPIDDQERELKTPKNRVKWDHILKMYKSNLELTKFSTIASGNGDCIGRQPTDGLFFKDCVLKLFRNLDLRKTDISRELTQLENSPFPIPYAAYLRDEKIAQLLESSFDHICDVLTDADKEMICKELEKIMLEKIFEWAFESTMGTTIDDRKEGWFRSWLEGRQFANSLSLDVMPLYDVGTKKCLKSFELRLKQPVDHAEMIDQINTTQFVLDYRQELIEKTITGLLEASLAS